MDSAGRRLIRNRTAFGGGRGLDQQTHARTARYGTLIDSSAAERLSAAVMANVPAHRCLCAAVDAAIIVSDPTDRIAGSGLGLSTARGMARARWGNLAPPVGCY